MELSNKIKYLSLLSIFLCLMPCMIVGQNNKIVRSIVAKVINLDTNIFSKEFGIKINTKPRQFYYAIYHFKVLNASGDTLKLAYVFDTKNQIQSALNNFGIKKDSVYKFDLISINICNCDFPSIIGCSYKINNSQSVYIPVKGSIITKPYTFIYRILDFTPIISELWDELHR